MKVSARSSKINMTLYLFDNQLGVRTGLELLQYAVSIHVTGPIIMLTDTENRVLDEQAMHEGAADFLIKTYLTSELLDRSIRYATERQRLLHEMSRIAKTEPLTGLANRSLFNDFIDGALARARRANSLLALLFRET